MLPFLQQAIQARKLLIYSGDGARHPMNAAELINSTSKTLDGGPITVFDASSYGGEALMETLKASEKRLISYAVDLGTNVTTALDSAEQQVRDLRYARGILTSRYAQQSTRTYTIRNVDQKAKTLIIEHPVRRDFKLVGGKPMETSATAYRFEVKLAPGATEKFPVVEEHEYSQTLSLTNLDSATIFRHMQNRALSEAGRKQLEKLAAIKKAMEDTQSTLRQNEAEIQNLTRDQDRLRRNIESLNQVAGQQNQVQSYARTLAEREAKLAALRDREAKLNAQRVTLEREANTLMAAMEF
ncbi:MAG: hypothetical protein WKF37_07270 [Bryobacteraceae bacterium]